MVELVETQQAKDFSALQARYDGLSGTDLLRPIIQREFHRKIALVSSFGTEAAVLLALAAEIDPGITGRKRFQASTRAALSAVELDVDGKIKVNPLASWSRDRIVAEFESRGLPRHPLEADGFLSIGCMPCTDRVAPGQDPRSGRWAGLNKTECGIHMSAA